MVHDGGALDGIYENVQVAHCFFTAAVTTSEF